jgi:2-succinyl-6-hydroxy-2,4-cyclohexadiene-1-carboxylate synthase
MSDSAPGLTAHRYGVGPLRLAALHGFTLDGGMFAELAEVAGWSLVAPDLPYHGMPPGPPVAGIAGAAAEVAAVLERIDPPIPLLGYSMGERVAIRTALDHPHLVAALVIVSATPGIADDGSRLQRERADRDLADHLEEVGLGVFLDEWSARPMFSGLADRGPRWLAADRRRRLGNSAPALAAALRVLGQGSCPPMWDELDRLEMQVLLVAGQRDAGYVAGAAALCRSLRRASVSVIPGAGHAVVGEAPGRLAAEITVFLTATGMLDAEHMFD